MATVKAICDSVENDLNAYRERLAAPLKDLYDEFVTIQGFTADQGIALTSMAFMAAMSRATGTNYETVVNVG